MLEECNSAVVVDNKQGSCIEQVVTMTQAVAVIIN